MSDIKFIDASAWVGPWPFGPGTHESASEIVAHLRSFGISGAVLSPIRAVLAPEPTHANRDLIRQVRELHDNACAIRVVPIVNPSIPNWQLQLAEVLEDAADLLGGVRLIPNYHGYSLSGSDAGSAIDELVATLAAFGLPLVVQARIIDERAHHPLMKVPAVPTEEIRALADRHPDLDILVAGLFNSELSALAEQPRLHIELSSVESDNTLPNVLHILPPSRVLFGTHAPIYDPLPGLAKLAGDDIDAETLSAISGQSARRLFFRDILDHGRAITT